MIKSIAEFVAFCREQGFRIGTQQVKECVQVVELGHLDKRMFQHSLRAICCKNKNQFDRFGSIFDVFWKQKKLAQKREKIKHEHKPRQSPASLIFLGASGTESSKENEAQEVTGANTIENLKRTDFSAVQTIDEKALDELAFQLWQQMSLRLKRRKKKKKKGELDLRRSLRKNISKGGWGAELVYRAKKKERRRLLLLLDISGSMDKYSFYLLKFIIVLRSYFDSIEAFAFSTQLYRITDLIGKKDLKDILKDISYELDAWSSGTKIGACLSQFIKIYGGQFLSKRSVVVILSDGLETGDPQKLMGVIRQIKRRAKSLIWLNPLKGMQGYQPIQRGMSTVLPYLDFFESAHNLTSLLKLEKYLKEV